MSFKSSNFKNYPESAEFFSFFSFAYFISLFSRFLNLQIIFFLFFVYVNDFYYCYIDKQGKMYDFRICQGLNWCLFSTVRMLILQNFMVFSIVTTFSNNIFFSVCHKNLRTQVHSVLSQCTGFQKASL